MGSLKAVKKESIHLESIVKKLKEQGVKAQICKRPKLSNEISNKGDNIR